MAIDEPMDGAAAQGQEVEVPVVNSALAVVEEKAADGEGVAPPPKAAQAAKESPGPVAESAPKPAQVQPEETPQEIEQPESDQPQQQVRSVPSASDTESENDEPMSAEQMGGDADVVVEVEAIELGDDNERQQGQPPQQAESAATAAVTDHHATNLLHEAVERQQKLREDSEKQQQEQLMRQLQRSPLAVVNAHPEAVQSEATDDEDVKTKNIPDLYYLFTNDKLKEEPLTKVLNSDPFCIPRLTDNVPEYRPAFNPLSILEGEEQLLPRYFRLDPYEGIPGMSGKSSSSSGNAGVVSQREKNARDRSTMSSIPIRAKQVSGKVSAFKGKTSTFMGTLPRRAEFSEIPVSDTIFQTQQTFRPTPPPPPAPHPSYASKTISSIRAANDWEAQQQQGLVASSAAPGEPITPTALTDAIFLTSLHQSGSHQQQEQPSSNTTHSHVYNHADHQFHDYYASKEASHQQHYNSQQYYDPQEQQHQLYHQDLEHDHHQQQQPEKLTRYLPSRSHSSGMSDHSGSPTPYMDEASYMVGHHHQYTHEHHNSNSGGGGQYLGSMFDDYRDSESHLTDDAMGGRASSSSMYGDDGSSSSQFMGGSGDGGDNQSLQPIPKKPRSKNVFRPCTAPGCTKGARGKSGLCQKHGGGKRCAAPNCSKGAQGSSAMCLFHGGGYRCTVDGCSTGARGTSGLCAKHGGYKRGKEPGGGGGGTSPASSNGGNGKRARTQHSPMDFDDHNDQSMDGLASFSARERVM